MNESNIRKNRKKVSFLAYRSWALKAIKSLEKSCGIEIVDLITTEEEYRNKVLQYADGHVDFIVLVGWSWIIKDDTLERFLCVSVHPSNLPLFRGGSPIQHQLISGIEETKISLMNITKDGIDVGDIWLKEDWNLSGTTMKQILNALTRSTVRLLKHFFEKYDTIVPIPQDLSKGTFYNRRMPEESKVTWEKLSEMQLKDVYNLIRALGDPYPNIYVEDQEGNRLLFKEVSYIPSKKNKN